MDSQGCRQGPQAHRPRSRRQSGRGMKTKRFRIISIILVLTVLSALAWTCLRVRAPEPVYKGKPLSYWLRAYDGNSPYSFTNTSIEPTIYSANAAIQAAGT